ncbi:MAG: dTDP-4-dehydrorhamnose 3,5-epimerase [Candidatus Omnitrophota bacterium]|jgi:dTDP-4-dehydrorhamnose 3,5-epimerase
MPFTFKKLEIPEVILVEPKVFPDSRGYFSEIYKQTDFSKLGILKPIAQINYSHSTKNVLRGLHFQKNPMAQGKLMQAISGEVFDVAVDIRRDSPTYGKWAGEILSKENLKILYIPEGFAHGFCVLSDTATITYYCTNVYSPENERGFRWDDQTVKIKWPVKSPSISERDSKLPFLKDCDNNFTCNE